MAIVDGQMFYLNGKLYRIVVDPNGQYSDGTTKYNLAEGPKPPDAGTTTGIPGENKNPQVGHGSVVEAPPVPGGHDHPGKGVTVVNTKAMKTFATNVGGLVADGGALKAALTDMDNVHVHAGGFRTAIALEKTVNGPGAMQGGTRQTLADMIEVLSSLADAVGRMANHYDNAEDANKMTSADYATYLGQSSGEINSMGGQKQQ
jgi:hypothetical protein